ncbi:alpha/beta hydrolase [Mycobacteroides abscessus]
MSIDKNDHDEVPAREDVSFRSGEDSCSAWLYRPSGTAAGVVVMAHGLGAVRWMRLDAFAEQFVKLGLAVVVFDYRYLGASGGQPRQLIDVDHQIEDWHAALAFARGLHGVDTDRVFIWGSAFSGGHVLRVAANDSKVRAVISVCPYTDGPSTFLARMRNGFLSSLVLALISCVDIVGSWIGARPVLIPLVGKPWMPAFITAPEAISGSARIAPPGTRLSPRASRSMRFTPALGKEMSEYIEFSDEDVAEEGGSIYGELSLPDGTFLTQNAIAARLFLRIPFYRPGRELSKISVPVLLNICDRDGIVLPGAARRMASGIDNVQLEAYPCDHFGIYVGRDFEKAVRDQTDFLARHLG